MCVQHQNQVVYLISSKIDSTSHLPWLNTMLFLFFHIIQIVEIHTAHQVSLAFVPSKFLECCLKWARSFLFLLSIDNIFSIYLVPYCIWKKMWFVIPILSCNKHSWDHLLEELMISTQILLCRLSLVWILLWNDFHTNPFVLDGTFSFQIYLRNFSCSLLLPWYNNFVLTKIQS